MRIALMGQTSPDVVREVARVMEAKLETVMRQEYSAAGGVGSLAADPQQRPTAATERNILEHLAEAEPRARRGGARAAVRLRGPAQARRPHDPARAQGGRLEGSRARPARRQRRGQGADPRPTCPQRARRDAARGDGVHAAAAPARRRGGAVEDRRASCAGSRTRATIFIARGAARATRTSSIA